MAIAITLLILALLATYGAARPDQLWFQHYAGRVARARSTRPGDPEHAFRRRTYLVTAVLCWLLAAVAFWAVWRGAQPPAPTAAVGDAVGARGGTPIALFSMTSDIGVIIGPLVAGWLSDRYGMHVAFTLGALLLAGAALHALRMPPGVGTATSQNAIPAESKSSAGAAPHPEPKETR